MRVLADTGLISGHSSLADFCFLVAFILAVIVGVMHLIPRELPSAFAWFAVALISLGLLVA